jgi:hypothetical protein
MPKLRKRGWRANVLIRCGVVLALGAGAAAPVALNWTKVSTFYHQAITTFADLRSVQTALQAKYHTKDLSVQAKRRSAVPGPILSVNFINPPFLKDSDVAGKSRRSAALGVATTARDALSPQGEYDHYEIAFTQQLNVGITISRSENYVFRFSELPPRSPR